MNPSQVAVIVPALDEEATIQGVIAAVPAGVRVVVVDNGSRDATAVRARQAGADVVVEPRRGYGRAVQAGLAHLAASPPVAVVVLDADGSDDPAGLAQLVSPILDGSADLVLADRTRVCEPGALTPPQRVGNALARHGLRLLTGHAYRDLGPFRALRWAILPRLRLSDPTWGFNVEMQLDAARAGLRIVEIALPYRNRQGGRSKISGTVIGTVRAGYRIVATLVRHAVR
ncbi:MAG: glycosyltransferase [Alphaproteobacteria bacterium]|nr:glycosyltransferase [Alphaproteobacteria bacterium]